MTKTQPLTGVFVPRYESITTPQASVHVTVTAPVTPAEHLELLEVLRGWLNGTATRSDVETAVSTIGAALELEGAGAFFSGADWDVDGLSRVSGAGQLAVIDLAACDWTTGGQPVVLIEVEGRSPLPA